MELRRVADFIVGACVVIGRVEDALWGSWGGQRRYHPFSAPVAGLGQLPGIQEQVTKDAAGVSQRKSLAGWMTGLERSRFLFDLSLL